MTTIDLCFASGESSLSVRRVQVHEAVSTLYTVAVWARSPQFDLDLESLVGEPAQLTIHAAEGNSLGGRQWSGVVSFMEQVQGLEDGAAVNPLSTYYLRIVPRLWLLTQRR